MANQRISDLTAGTPPYAGTTLLELSVAGASRKALLSDLVSTVWLDQWIIDWDSNTPVVAGTSVVLLASQWTSCTILSCTCSCSGGTFTLNIQDHNVRHRQQRPICRRHHIDSDYLCDRIAGPRDHPDQLSEERELIYGKLTNFDGSTVISPTFRSTIDPSFSVARTS
jgi:hypothetical protein